MKNTNKRGFTIVELVIVIAVIAILAAILIPTFSSIIQKANASADKQIIKNLNTEISNEKILGATFETMSDVLAIAKTIGYSVDNLNAKAMNTEILWDSANSLFCYFNGEEIEYIPEYEKTVEAKDVEYWIIKKVTSQNDISTKYSTYMRADSTLANVETSKGLDVGECTAVQSVKYENKSGEAQTAVIRTNNYKTEVSVDAPLDTVKHYGKVGAVSIAAVADHSYIEYGSGAIIEVKNGHVNLTADSDIKRIHITKEEIEAGESDKFDNILITVAEGVDLPEMTRDSVTIPAEGIKVCTVETADKKEDVVLYNYGIYEQIKLETTDANGNVTSFRYTDDTALDDKQATAAWMLANVYGNGTRERGQKITEFEIGEGTAAKKTVTFDYESERDFVEKGTENIVAVNTVTDSGVEFDEIKETAIASMLGDVWDGSIDDSWYSDSKNEFTIKTAEELAGLAKLVNEGKTFEGKTVKLGNDIDLNPNANLANDEEDHFIWTAIGYAYGSYVPRKPFCGTFDGQGYAVKNMYRRCYNTTEYFSDTYGAIYPYGLFGCVKNATIKNLTVDNAYFAGEEDVWYTNAMGGFVGVAFGDCTFDSLTLQNSYLCAYISNCGGIVGGCTSGNMTFNNISVDKTNILTTWDWGCWSSCDCQIGGIIGQMDIQDSYPDAQHTNANGLYTTHVSFNNCTVACQLMQMNDVMSHYAWYQYRSSGMLVGGFTHNRSDGLWNNADNVTDTMLQNALTCNNVNVVYDLWNHQYYCCATEHDESRQYAGDHAGRFNKANNFLDTVENNGTHADGCCGEHDCLVFDQLVGGWSGGTWRYDSGKSFESLNGVTVSYLNGSRPEADE